MKLGHKTIPYRITSPVRLVALGDLHVGSSTFARRRFKKFMEEQAEIPQTHFIIMGDVFDALVVADSKRFRLSNIDKRYFDCPNPDRFLDAQIDDAIELLSPYSSKILGILRGNHEDQILKRYNTDMIWQLCDRLGDKTLDLGYSALLYLQLKYDSEKNRNTRAIRVFLHHGYGGGSRTEGGAITTYSRFITYYDADIYLVGHSHQQWSKKIARVSITRKGDWEDRTIILANSGTFKKSLVEGVAPSWEETMGFCPRLLGGVAVEIKLNSGNTYPELSVSDI